MHVSLFLTTVISSTQQRTRLRHKASGRIVCVVAMHLMTTSRDGPGVQGRWRSGVFELVEAQEERVIACNTTTNSLSNHDLLEKWHPLVVPPTDGGGVTATDLPAADRRQAAVARLRHKASGRIVCVVAVHLMTTSRDGLCGNQDLHATPARWRGGVHRLTG